MEFSTGSQVFVRQDPDQGWVKATVLGALKDSLGKLSVRTESGQEFDVLQQECFLQNTDRTDVDVGIVLLVGS